MEMNIEMFKIRKYLNNKYNNDIFNYIDEYLEYDYKFLKNEIKYYLLNQFFPSKDYIKDVVQILKNKKIKFDLNEIFFLHNGELNLLDYMFIEKSLYLYTELLNIITNNDDYKQENLYIFFNYDYTEEFDIFATVIKNNKHDYNNLKKNMNKYIEFIKNKIFLLESDIICESHNIYCDYYNEIKLLDECIIYTIDNLNN